MGDLICRQAAIDAFLTELTKRERKNLLHTWSTVEVKYFITKMLEQMPSAQPEQQWIPLGRPMNSGTYLVTLRQKFEGEESYRVRIMRLIEGHWMLPKHFPEWINEEMEQEVLAWMPLPEPWRGEQE